MPILGVNHRLPILHMPEIIVHCYNTYETINKFAIGYMINPSLKFNNAFRTQVETFLGVSFSIRRMKNIKYFPMKKNTCVMSIINIYENNE